MAGNEFWKRSPANKKGYKSGRAPTNNFWENSLNNKKRVILHTEEKRLMMQVFEDMDIEFGCGPTLTELQGRTELSSSMVRLCIKELIEEGKVVEMGSRPTARKYVLAVKAKPDAIKEIEKIARTNRYREIVEIIDDYYN
jgi:hypothetical protein